MTRPIGRFLADFTPVASPLDVLPGEAGQPLDAAATEAERVRLAIDAARAEGLAEGRRLAEAAAADRFRAVSAEHVDALEAARAGWAEQEGKRLADGLRNGLTSLETRLADDLAAAIGPLVAPASRQRATADLREALAALMAGTHGALVEIRGPGDIIDPLRTALGDNPAVVLTPADDAEVSVEAGDTTIRTQLQAWGEHFEKALLAAA